MDQIEVRERVLVDRNTVISATNQTKSFESIRKLAVDMLLRGQRLDTTSKRPTPVATSTSERSKSSSSSQPTTAAKETPIIIVPATLTALITLYNVKKLLKNGQYVSMSELQKKGLGTKESEVTVERKNPKTGQTISYRIVDSIDRIMKEDWKNVVAVFVSGQQWQFKGWKWEQPVDLFSNGNLHTCYFVMMN